MLDRRRFLISSAAAGTVALAGCAGFSPTVRVAVPWSGVELNAFRAVLRGLDLREYRVELVPLGDDIATAFDQHSSQRPDVMLLSRPGLVAEHLAELAPVSDLVPAWPYGEVWRSVLQHGDELYGIPFKVTHKSVVWYRRSVFERFGLSVPQRWTEWRRLNATLAGRGVPPLALGGADGWTLTDFFENVLAGCAPQAYLELARTGAGRTRLDRAPEVAVALELLGEMWADDGAIAGGVATSLVQQWADAVVQVFGYGKAAMVVVPDFAEPVVRRFADDLDDVAVFAFPTIDATSGPPHRPLVIGGDVAVLSNSTDRHARDLVKRLATPEAPLPWIGDLGGFLAARDTSAARYGPQLRTLAADLAERRAEVRFDLSDQLGGIGGSAGLWQVLQDFLARVGGRGAGVDMRHEVTQVIARMRELEG